MDEQKNTITQEKAAPIYHAEMTVSPKEKSRPVGFWTFVGLILLFGIPFIGLIAAIIFFFSSKNKNIKNFSGATLAIIITQFIATVLITLLIVSTVLGIFLPKINQTFGTQFNSVYQVAEIATSILQGNYSQAVSTLVPAIKNALGDEYEDFLIELSSGRYEELLHQLKNKEYNRVFSDILAGKYPELLDTLDEDEYAMLMRELANATEGEKSEFLEILENLVP